MRLAVISDVHLEFADFPLNRVPAADVHVVAGDLHPDPEVRARFLKALPGEVLFVPGNHDYYRGAFPEPEEGCFVREIAGVRFAGATLWTGFPERWWPDFKRAMTDARVIEGISYERLRAAHEYHLQFLIGANADIIITHHAPTWASLPPELEMSIYNPFYASPILDRAHPFTTTHLWIHGHVHTCRLHEAGGVKVLCHARGYPFEQGLAETFRLLDVSRNDQTGALRIDPVESET